MPYGKDRTSNVSPWGDRTSSVRWVSWRRGEGRKGRKGTTWSPWTGQLWQRKSPKGITQGAAKGTRLLAIQGRRLVPREASKGNKGSTRLGSLGREVGASSDHADQKENGRAPVGTSPVGLHDASFGATCGRGGIKRGMPNESKDRVLIRGVHALVFEDFGCGNAVGIAGLGLHVFHGFIGRQSPGESHGVSPVDSPGRFRHRQSVSDPYRGQE